MCTYHHCVRYYRNKEMPFVSEKLGEEYSPTIVEYGHLYGGIAFCICLTSVTRAILNEKMAFPA